jgi:hypothetical protein
MEQLVLSYKRELYWLKIAIRDLIKWSSYGLIVNMDRTLVIGHNWTHIKDSGAKKLVKSRNVLLTVTALLHPSMFFCKTRQRPARCHSGTCILFFLQKQTNATSVFLQKQTNPP